MLLTKEKILKFFTLLLSLAWLNACEWLSDFMMFVGNEFYLKPMITDVFIFF